MKPTNKLAVLVTLVLVAVVTWFFWDIEGVGRLRAVAQADDGSPSMPEALSYDPESQLVEPPLEDATSGVARDQVAVLPRGAQETSSSEAAVAWLRRVLPDPFGRMTAGEIQKVEEIILHGAEVSDADLHHLASFPGLRRLGLRGTAITDHGVAILGQLDQLEHLDLRDTKVSGECLGLLPTRELRALHLTGTQVTGDDLLHLPTIPRLATLKLNFLSLTDDAIEALSIYPGLRHVELDRTALTDAGLMRLLELNPELTRIEARGTKVSAEAVAQAKTTYLGCEIVFEDVDPVHGVRR